MIINLFVIAVEGSQRADVVGVQLHQPTPAETSRPISLRC